MLILIKYYTFSGESLCHETLSGILQGRNVSDAGREGPGQREGRVQRVHDDGVCLQVSHNRRDGKGVRLESSRQMQHNPYRDGPGDSLHPPGGHRRPLLRHGPPGRHRAKEEPPSTEGERDRDRWRHVRPFMGGRNRR